MPAAFNFVEGFAVLATLFLCFTFLWLKPFKVSGFWVSGLTSLRASPFNGCAVSRFGLEGSKAKRLEAIWGF